MDLYHRNLLSENRFLFKETSVDNLDFKKKPGIGPDMFGAFYFERKDAFAGILTKFILHADHRQAL